MGSEVEIGGDFLDAVLHSLHHLSIRSGPAAVCDSPGLELSSGSAVGSENRLVKIHFRIHKIPSALGQMLCHYKTLSWEWFKSFRFCGLNNFPQSIKKSWQKEGNYLSFRIKFLLSINAYFPSVDAEFTLKLGSHQCRTAGKGKY